MFNRLSALVCSLAIFIAGCGGDSVPESPRVEAVDITVSYVESDTLNLIEREFSDGDRIIFSFIPGYFFGNVDQDILVDAIVDDIVEITLDRSIFTESSKPEILTVEGANDGLTVTPIDAKFGRLAGFVVDASGVDLPNDGRVFYNQKTDLEFILVYFDQAAVLSGSIESTSATQIFDLEIPGEGFYALGSTMNEGSNDITVFNYRVIDLQNEASLFLREEG